jgi:general secretion pathway protein L
MARAMEGTARVAMLSEFASWYVDRMAEMVPGLARGHADEGPADALVVDMRGGAAGGAGGGEGSLLLIDRARRRDRVLGEFVMDTPGLTRARAALGGKVWPEIMVMLPRGTLLERSVSLPAVAEAGLDSVLGYEMDRYTPFAAEEVYWNATVTARDREQERIRVRIVLVPRARLAPVVDMMDRLGIAPTLVESAAIDGVPRYLPLRAPDATADRRARRWLIAAGVACAMLGIAAAGLPFLRQSWEADAVDARIAALQPSVDHADALRKTLMAQSAGSDVIAAEELRLGEPLQALAALTQLIPDDTFLTVLTLHERQLSIDGQSASAARLIGLLSTDPVIRNAAFAAPVTRTEDGADMFSLKAEVRS